MTKRKLKWGYVLGGVLMISIAVISIVLMYRQILRWNEFKKTAVETQATITNIKTRRTGSRKHRHTTHTVYISYSVDDITYNDTLGYYTAGMRTGTKVTVYYDPENPAHTENKPYLGAVYVVLFAIFFTVSGTALLKLELSRHFYIKRLIYENSYVICDQWKDLPSNTSVNNVRYHYTKCTYLDPSGMTYNFSSESYHPNKQPFSPGDKIKVYVDLYTPEKYYVALEPVRDPNI